MPAFILRTELDARQAWECLKPWRGFAEEGKPLAVDIRTHKAKRSNRANRRYWSILNQIAEDGWLGKKRFPPETWHFWFRAKFLGYEEGIGGQMIPVSTTTLNTAEFAEYMANVERYAVTELEIELEPWI